MLLCVNFFVKLSIYIGFGITVCGPRVHQAYAFSHAIVLDLYYNTPCTRQLSFTLFYIDAFVNINLSDCCVRRSMYVLHRPIDYYCSCYDNSILAADIKSLKVYRTLLIFFINYHQKFTFKSYRYLMYYNNYLTLTYLFTITYYFVLSGVHRNNLVLNFIFLFDKNLCRYRSVIKYLIFIMGTTSWCTLHNAGSEVIISPLSCNICVIGLEFRYNVAFIFGLVFIYYKYFKIFVQWLP